MDNYRENQLAVTSDGRTAFFYAEELNHIQAFDVATGTARATSASVDLWGFNRFEVDESRGFLLVPPRKPIGSFIYTRQLLALDASTLALIGTASGGNYGQVMTFQPLIGRGNVGAYLVSTPFDDGAAISCRTVVDAFNTAGGLAARVDIAQQTGMVPGMFSGCVAMAAVLSPPSVPTGFTPTVQGNRVALMWTNPGDTSGFRLEVGLAPGRTDLTLPLGLGTTAVFDGVPSGVYYVRIRALNEIGSSPASQEIAVLVP